MSNKKKIDETLELKAKVIHGFSVLIIREFLIKSFSLVGQLFLARILSPEDFGYFAIISFIVNFFGLFSDIGFSWSIIKKKENLTEKETSTIFFIKLTLAIFLILCILFLAPFSKLFYPNFDSQHVMMLRFFSIYLLLISIRSIPIAFIEREIRYNVIAIIEITGVLAYLISALTMALIGFGLWSLIFSVILKEFVEIIMAFSYKRLKISLSFSFKDISEMARFGVFIQGGGIINFIHASIAPVIVGVKNGAYAVGLLDWASNIVSVPESIISNYGRIAFSAFSRLQQDRLLLAKFIEKSIKVLSIIMLFYIVIIFAFSYEIVRVLYTEKWLGGVPVLYWYATNTFLIAIMSSVGQGILALGKSKYIFIAIFIVNILEWILAFALVSFLNFVGAAIASTIASFITFYFYVNIAKRLGILPELKKILLPKIFVSILTLAFAFGMNSILPKSLIILILKVFATCAIYISFMLAISREEIMFCLKVFYRMFHSIKYK